MNLVTIRPLLPNAIFDLRYATDNNFTGRVLYAADFQPQLEVKAAEQLVYAAKLFLACTVVPVIWDTYRPREVQTELLRHFDDPRYVLDPDASNHPKGLAADMTLARPDGELLDMGTDYDDFTEKAHADTDLITPQQKANRAFMANIMGMAGFQQLPTEWWHFDFTNGNGR